MLCVLILVLFWIFLFIATIITSFFFFNDTATTQIYTLSLHDALPIYDCNSGRAIISGCAHPSTRFRSTRAYSYRRSEEHTSELQSRQYLVCRLLLEKKKNNT